MEGSSITFMWRLLLLNIWDFCDVFNFEHAILGVARTI